MMQKKPLIATTAGKRKKKKPSPTPRPKLLAIDWLDHCSLDDGGWVRKDMAMGEGPVLICSVGYLISENKQRVILAGSIQPDQPYIGSTMLILKTDIVKRRVLK